MQSDILHTDCKVAPILDKELQGVHELIVTFDLPDSDMVKLTVLPTQQDNVPVKVLLTQNAVVTAI